MLTRNVMPRRIVKHTTGKTHRCASCGIRGFLHSAGLPFCEACLEWARQRNLVEWDDLGGGD